jgi:hypothetical protein
MTERRETPIFQISLRPLPDVKDPVFNLRLLLKIALRRFHLKCIAAHEEKDAS